MCWNEWKINFPIFIFRVTVIFVLKSPKFSMNFHDNSKNKNREMDFSIDSAHCASLIKTGANLMGGGFCIVIFIGGIVLRGIVHRWNCPCVELGQKGFSRWNFPRWNSPTTIILSELILFILWHYEISLSKIVSEITRGQFLWSLLVSYGLFWSLMVSLSNPHTFYLFQFRRTRKTIYWNACVMYSVNSVLEFVNNC